MIMSITATFSRSRGNHDWYDGLTSFLRVFHAPRWIGCWKTQQRRSYFALDLPYKWWLWGVDTALEDDLDGAQIEYFRAAAEKLKEGDRVIFCVPNPVWSENPELLTSDTTTRKSGDKFSIIHELAADRTKDYRVLLCLSGDLHHYARHETAGDEPHRQFIVCGGGGAFTLGTSLQPKSFDLPRGQSAQLKKCFPSDEESRAMRWGALLFPFTSPDLPPF
ncbi:MAG: hypothetical protein J2P49_01355 [Methylocapsa sp.]|nr:hypothetical protein [Methylocapsa sp.]